MGMTSAHIHLMPCRKDNSFIVCCFSMTSCIRQTLVEQRRPLAANLRRGIGALREKEEKEQSSAPSYGSSVT